MTDYEPNLSRIDPNPFSFKSSRKEADDLLTGCLRSLGVFFADQHPQAGEIEAAWQEYQDLKGVENVIRLASSIRHVSGLQHDLESIGSCDTTHQTARLGSIQILLHLGLAELVEGGSYVHPFDWALGRLKDDDLPEVWSHFATNEDSGRHPTQQIRRFLTALKKAYSEEKGNRGR